MTTEEFAAAFIGRLAEGGFHSSGSLADYLARPEAERGGDEADVVDSRVTRILIAALGYSTAEASYNVTKDQQRPDFTLRIREYPGLCLIIEDKATVEAPLEKHRPQLAAYMSGSRCPRGLLLNGATLLAYEASGPLAAAALRFSIVAAVRLWRGEDLLAAGHTGWEALGRPERDALAVILRRYGRAAFASVTRLIDDLCLDANGQPHALDGSSWRDGGARLRIVDVRDAPDGLVEAIQALIVELREDVAVQFAVHQQDHQAFLDETARAPGSTVPAAAQMQAIGERILSILPARAEGRRSELALSLRQAMSGERALSTIAEVEADIRLTINGRAPTAGGDPLRRASNDARAFANKYAAHRNRAAARHEAALSAMADYQKWRAALGVLLDGNEARAQDEYFAQTAYIVIVRMLLIRILEDKGLTPRIFTNGGAALWFGQVEERYFSLSVGRSAARFIEIAYENAQATYAHFYDGHRVFDWYVPDRSMLVRVLHRLAGFDLKEIDRDIIGTVYGRFVNDRHKHEQGMYYTPPGVVAFILDRVEWRGRAVVGRRLLDPACGSGAFLVEAARRVLDAHRAQALADGHAAIPPERVQFVLDSLRDGLVGFDLNPFACALAEINLLVQVLELVASAIRAGLPLRMDRFRIHNTDGLRPGAAARAVFEGGLDPAEAEDLPDEEQAKLRLGHFSAGFDVVVGNPPYVRADEGSAGQEEYRAQVSQHPMPEVREVLWQKWDLFVPFVALGRMLLRPGGRLGMIVSNAVETVLYGRRLRNWLSDTSALREVHFFEPGVKLFEDAAVRNTILVAGALEPGAGHEVLREWHAGPPPAAVRRQRLPQAAYGAEVFRPSLPALRLRRDVTTRKLKELCYVSVGMVLSAHENRKDETGRSLKGRFVLADLLASAPDEAHSRPYVGSESLRLRGALVESAPFAPMRIRYLEYGTARVPSQVRRPTFAALYNRPKIMIAKFGSVIHDQGDFDPLGYLVSNHTVFLGVPWHAFRGVVNGTLDERAGELASARHELEEGSKALSLSFLTGFLNSQQFVHIIASMSSEAISGGTQPNDYSEQPIPLPDPALAADIGHEVAAAQGHGQALAGLLALGWKRRPEGWAAPPSGGGNTAPFALARTRWGLSILNGNARCDRLRREGSDILAGRAVVATLAPDLAPEAGDHLMRVLATQGRASLLSAEQDGLRLILDPAEAATAEHILVQAEGAALRREHSILSHRAGIDGLLAPLFEALPHPPIEIIGPPR